MWTPEHMEKWLNEHSTEKYMNSVGGKPQEFDHIWVIEPFAPFFFGAGWLKIILRKNNSIENKQTLSYSYQHVPSPIKNHSFFKRCDSWEEMAKHLLHVCALFDPQLQSIIDRDQLIQKNAELLLTNEKAEAL